MHEPFLLFFVSLGMCTVEIGTLVLLSAFGWRVPRKALHFKQRVLLKTLDR